jgi:hypothetical protein
VNVRVTSELAKGQVNAEVNLSQGHSSNRSAERALVRFRLPAGWRVASAKANEADVVVDEKGTIDITELGQNARLKLSVARP